MMPYDLFSIGYQNTDTSRDARPTPATASTVRAKVLDLLRQDWMTCDEVAAALHLGPLTVRPRITELRNAEKVIDTGLRRQLDSGKSGIVWRAV